MNSNNMFRRTVIITAIATAGCLGIAVIVGLTSGGFVPLKLGSSGTTIDERRSLSPAGVDLISIRSVSDRVRVAEGTGDAIEAWLHGTVGTAAADAVPHLSVDRVGSTAEIRLDRKHLFLLAFAWKDLVLEVSLPKGYRGKLAARSVSADLDVTDHAYDSLALSTTSGAVRTGMVTAGEFSARTTSGELNLGSIVADRSDLSSVSGRIMVKSLTGDVTARSVSGSMALIFAEVPGQLVAKSTSGAVSLRLPVEASFALDARSTSGDVACRFPLIVEGGRTGGGNHVLVGKVGTGAGSVTVRTVSGDIRVTP